LVAVLSMYWLSVGSIVSTAALDYYSKYYSQILWILGSWILKSFLSTIFGIIFTYMLPEHTHTPATSLKSNTGSLRCFLSAALQTPPGTWESDTIDVRATAQPAERVTQAQHPPPQIERQPQQSRRTTTAPWWQIPAEISMLCVVSTVVITSGRCGKNSFWTKPWETMRVVLDTGVSSFLFHLAVLWKTILAIVWTFL
jgi:hypothetical protein